MTEHLTIFGSRSLSEVIAKRRPMYIEPETRTPPNAEDVEKLLAGIAIAHPEWLEVILAGIGEGDCYVPPNGGDNFMNDVFSAMRQLVEEGRPVTTQSLATIVGNAKYLAELVISAQQSRKTKEVIEDLIGQVQRAALARVAIVATTEAQAKIFEGGDPLEAAAEVSARIESYSSKGPANALRVRSANELLESPAPPRQSTIDPIVPRKSVTLLSGDGGGGKSLIGLQGLACVATGRPFFGMAVQKGPAIAVCAEDSEEELQRRIHAIARSMGTSRIPDLHVISLHGREAVIASVEPGTEIVRPTPLFAQITRNIERYWPALVLWDTSADLFAVNENSRPQARQCVGLLQAWHAKTNSAGILLSHPSLDGIRSGRGSSGSTAWSNSVRSRLYLDRVKDGDREPNPDARVLRVMKANYGRVGDEIKLAWHEGVFVLDADGRGGAERAAQIRDREKAAEELFLWLLAKLTKQGRNCSHSPGRSYAPKLFVDDPECGDFSKREFEQAQARLLDRGRLRVVGYGAPSKNTKRLEAC